MPTSNEVTVAGSMITAMEYIAGSFVITSGQSGSPPPSFSQNGTTWTITIGADRKNSGAVAQSFKSTTGGSGYEYAPSGGGGGSPDELNFYLGVSIGIQTGAGVVNVPVYLGQGHFGLTNNWWIGGNTVINHGQPLLLAISGNTVQSVLKLSGDVHSFNLAPV